MSEPNSNENKPDPSDEGRKAFEAGIAWIACPYPDDSPEAVEWEGAWLEAEETECDNRSHSHE